MKKPYIYKKTTPLILILIVVVSISGVTSPLRNEQSLPDGIESPKANSDATSRDTVSLDSYTGGDVVLSNTELTIKMNGTILSSPTGALFSSVTSTSYNVEIDPEGSYENYDVTSGTGGQDGTASYAATDIFVETGLVYNNSQAYRIITPRSTSNYAGVWNATIILPNDRSYFLIRLEISNNDTQPILIDEIASHIHDGINALWGIRAQLGSGTFPTSTTDDQLYINGVGTVGWTGTTYWSAYTPSSTAPYFTMSDTNTGDAITVGYLAGSTAINQMIPFYRMTSTSDIRAHVDTTVKAATIPVGEKVTYDFFVGVHDTDTKTGGQLYSDIAAEYTNYLSKASNSGAPGYTQSSGDLVLNNTKLTIKMNGTLLANPTGSLFSSVTSTSYNVEIDPEGSYENYDVTSGTGGQDGTASYAATDIFVETGLVYNNAQAYRIITPRSTANYAGVWNATIILPDDRSYFLIRLEISNNDTQPILIDEIASHIHDGINALWGIRAQLGSGAFPTSTTDDQLYINGVGTVGWSGSTYWNAYTPSSTAPYFTMSDTNTGDAITVGYLAGSTAINQMIPFYRMTSTSDIRAHVDTTVKAATIPVGEKVTYDFFVGIHDTDTKTGGQLYSDIAAEYTNYLDTSPNTEILKEDFNSNAIWNDSQWYRTGTYYTVDENNGWLHKATAGTYADWVTFQPSSLQYPVTIETRSRINSGGYGYTASFTQIDLTNGSKYSTTYAPDNWRFLGRYSYSTYGPQNEGEWFSYRIVIDQTIQRLYARADGDPYWILIDTYYLDFTSSTPQSVTVGGSWDPIMDVDYLYIWSPSVQSTTTPGYPTNLQATAGDGTVDLSWSAPSDNGGATVTEYRVYRSTSSGSGYTFIGSSTTTSYTDTGVSNGMTYHYVVTAVNDVGESGYSEEVSATPSATTSVPGVPTNLQATAGDGTVDLSWSAPSDNGGLTVSSYKVYRSTTSGSDYSYIGSTTSTNYSDTSVLDNIVYYYVITAVNSAGESDYSEEISIMITLPNAEITSAPEDRVHVLTEFGTSITDTYTWIIESDIDLLYEIYINGELIESGTLNTSQFHNGKYELSYNKTYSHSPEEQVYNIELVIKATGIVDSYEFTVVITDVNVEISADSEFRQTNTPDVYEYLFTMVSHENVSIISFTVNIDYDPGILEIEGVKGSLDWNDKDGVLTVDISLGPRSALTVIVSFRVKQHQDTSITVSAYAYSTFGGKRMPYSVKSITLEPTIIDLVFDNGTPTISSPAGSDSIIYIALIALLSLIPSSKKRQTN